MEAVNGASDGGPPPPSPLTGCYLLIVIGEPHSQEHKDIILRRVAKGLLSWDLSDCMVDLEKELAIITEQAPEGEEARYGERLIQYASENLVTEILIHPVVSTLSQCVRNLLSSFTRHRHIIHSGYTFAANGSWALQDGTFSLADFSEAFQELEVQRVIRAYDNGISVDIHCSPEGDWTRLPKEPFAKNCKVRLNPVDVMPSSCPAIADFLNYITPYLLPLDIITALESSEVVGNIRFSHPTLYVFPGGQGDAALFGINGFNMLLDGGFSRKACFWDFVRHLDRLDAVLLTRLNNGNVSGITSVLKRKRQNAVYPQIGHFFCNIQERKALLSPDGDKDRDPLLINLMDEGQDIVTNLKHLNLNPQACYRDSEPINLYHKVGHGTLNMYVLSPAKDSREVREFIQKWNSNDIRLFSNPRAKEFSFPLSNLVSICALLVWQPSNSSENITRILFPGSTPQTKIFEGLDRLKQLDCIKYPVCSEISLNPPKKTKEQIFDSSKSQKILPEVKKERSPRLNEIKPKEVKETPRIQDNKINDTSDVKKEIKKSDSTDSDKSAAKSVTKVEQRVTKDAKETTTSTRTSRLRDKESKSIERKPVVKVEKKPSPTTPKKTMTNGDIAKPKPKLSPSATPAKSAKEATNRKVLESKKQTPKDKKEPKPVDRKAEAEKKVERKPISRRPKPAAAPAVKAATGSPIRKKPESIAKKAKLDKEGTTDSSTVSTPTADVDLKRDISKLTPEELEQLRAQELADLQEEQEVVQEIEAVFRKGEEREASESEMRKIKNISIEEKTDEDYLVIEKVEVQEDEIQKLTRDSEESEKQRKPSEPKVEVAKEIISPEEKVDKVESGTQPDEKFSATVESGATTAPTLPEDERIPLDEIKEKEDTHVIEEKHVKEETKEKESIPVIQLPSKSIDSTPPVKTLPVVGIRLDKQQHIRDIVKTPDEVADLPVHEVADQYADYQKNTDEQTTIIAKEVLEDTKADVQKGVDEMKNDPKDVVDEIGEKPIVIIDKVQDDQAEEDGQEKNDINVVGESKMAVEEAISEVQKTADDINVEEKVDAKELVAQHIEEVKMEAVEVKESLKTKEKVEEITGGTTKETTTGIIPHTSDEAQKIEAEDVVITLEVKSSEEVEIGQTKIEQVVLESTETTKVPEENIKLDKQTEGKSLSKDTDDYDQTKSAEKEIDKQADQIPDVVQDEKIAEEAIDGKLDEKKSIISDAEKTITENIADDMQDDKSPETDYMKDLENVIVETIEKIGEEVVKEIIAITEEAKTVVDLELPDAIKESIEETTTTIEEKPEEVMETVTTITDSKESISDIVESIKKEVVAFITETTTEIEETVAEAKIEITNVQEEISAPKENIKETVEIIETTVEEPIDAACDSISKTEQKIDDTMENISEIATEKVEQVTDYTDVKEKNLIEEAKDEDDNKYAEASIIVQDVDHDISEVINLKDSPESPCPTPFEYIDKVDLGRKSPKEREQDVAKIVASVAEVLKSEAPLEDFKGKIPLEINTFPTFAPFTTELRETHITTVDSQMTEMSGQITPIKEEKMDEVLKEMEDDIDSNSNTSKVSALIKTSNELLEASSKIISGIKERKEEEILEKVEEEEEIQDSGTVHRMLVTASSEDGGEETIICPPGSITFPKSSDSSGKSSPDIRKDDNQKPETSSPESSQEAPSVLQKEPEISAKMKSEDIPETKDKVDIDEKKPEIVNHYEDNKEVEERLEMEIRAQSSGRSTPHDLKSGKSTPDVAKADKVDEDVAEPEIPKSGTETPDISKPETTPEIEADEIGKSTPDIVKSGKVTPEEPILEKELNVEDTKVVTSTNVPSEIKVVDHLASEATHSGKNTPDVPKSGKSTPDISQSDQVLFEVSKAGKSTPDIPKSGKSTPDIIKSGKTTPEVPAEVVTTDKVISDVIKSDTTIPDVSKSGISTPDISKSEKVTPDIDELHKSEVLPVDKVIQDISKSGETTPDVPISGVESPELPKSGKTTPDMPKLDKMAADIEVAVAESVKSEVSKSEILQSEKTTPDISKSGMTSPDIPILNKDETVIHVVEKTVETVLASSVEIKETLSMQTDISKSEKTTPDVSKSGKTSPDIPESKLTEDKALEFGKTSPDICKLGSATPDISKTEVVGPVEVLKSGKTTPDVSKSGKVTPDGDKMLIDDLKSATPTSENTESEKVTLAIHESEKLSQDVKSGKSTPDALKSGITTSDIPSSDDILDSALQSTQDLIKSDQHTPEISKDDMPSSKEKDTPEIPLSGTSTPDITKSGKASPDKVTLDKLAADLEKSTPYLEKSGKTSSDISQSTIITDHITVGNLPTSGKSTPEIPQCDKVTTEVGLAESVEKSMEKLSSGKSSPDKPQTELKQLDVITDAEKTTSVTNNEEEVIEETSVKKVDIDSEIVKPIDVVEVPLEESTADVKISDKSILEMQKSGKLSPELEHALNGKISPSNEIIGDQSEVIMEFNESTTTSDMQEEKKTESITLTSQITTKTHTEVTELSESAAIDETISERSSPVAHEVITDYASLTCCQRIENEKEAELSNHIVNNVDSGKATPEVNNISGKSSPDTHQVVEKSQDIEKSPVLSGKVTPDMGKSGKSSPDFGKGDSIKLDTDSLASGKATPDVNVELPSSVPQSIQMDTDSLASGKVTPDVKHELSSGKITPDVEKHSAAMETDSLASGKQTPDLKNQVVSGKSTPDVVFQDSSPVQEKTSDKSTPESNITNIKTTVHIDKEETSLMVVNQSEVFSSKSAQDTKDDSLHIQDNLKLEKSMPLDDLSSNNTPDVHKDDVSSERDSVQVDNINNLLVESQISGKSSPANKSTDIIDGRKDSIQVDYCLSGKSTPDVLREEIMKISGKESPVMDDSLIMRTDSIQLPADNISSGKTTPEVISEVSKQKSCIDLFEVTKSDSVLSGKVTPDLTHEEEIKRESITSVASGKVSPKEAKADDKLITSDKSTADVGKCETMAMDSHLDKFASETQDGSQLSGKSSPEKEALQATSGKSTPISSGHQNGVSRDSIASGKSTPGLSGKVTPEPDISSGKTSPEATTKTHVESKTIVTESKEVTDGLYDSGFTMSSTVTTTSVMQSSVVTTAESLKQEIKTHAISTSASPDFIKRSSIQAEHILSGKSTPDSAKCTPHHDGSGKSSPDFGKRSSIQAEHILSGRSSPDVVKSDLNRTESLPISGQSTPQRGKISPDVHLSEDQGKTADTTKEVTSFDVTQLQSAHVFRELMEETITSSIDKKIETDGDVLLEKQESSVVETIKEITSGKSTPEFLKDSRKSSVLSGADESDYRKFSITSETTKTPSVMSGKSTPERKEDRQSIQAFIDAERQSEGTSSKADKKSSHSDLMSASTLHADPMSTSFYGALPDDSDDEALDPHRRRNETDLMTSSFIGDLPIEDKVEQEVKSWGPPLGLPSPMPASDNKGTPKREKRLPMNVSVKNKLNQRSESPSKKKKLNPIYVDLTYVPHHGNSYYSQVDFFKRVRARYYVFSGIEPSKDVYNALLEAKQTWEDKELEVTIIPTYDTDILGYWVAENEELLTKFKIDLSPSASRCTINLQDHETSCSAYRLEF